jgi:two-component system cell cycle response regulator
MSRGNQILMVDDNPTNQEIIEEVLGGDYELLSAENGVEALRLAERYLPRVVLLDVMLPGINGYDLCHRIRHMPNLSDVYIIMVTAKAMPSERAQGFAAGADAYLTKPFDEGELMAAIRSSGITPCLGNAYYNW